MSKEEKAKEAAIRRLILKVGKEYGATEIDYLDKNSNVTNPQALKLVAIMHIKNTLIRDNFLRKVNKEIEKL